MPTTLSSESLPTTLGRMIYMSIILLVCQGGKTFQMLKKIFDTFKTNDKKTVNIMLCDNSLQQVTQLYNRITVKGKEVYKDDD